MKILIALTLLISSMSLFAQDTGTNAVATPPPIPEEARKHFVMGTALFKDAKTPNDYTQVVSEFKQATDLAPQWPDPRYDLALAKEAAGDYSDAEADLKLYQQFKLSDDEARTVQDKIYVLEAKLEKKTSADAAKAEADAANAQAAAKKDNFDGATFISDSDGVRRIIKINGDEVIWSNEYEGVLSQVAVGHLNGKRIHLGPGDNFVISDDGQLISRYKDDWTIMEGQPIYNRQ